MKTAILTACLVAVAFASPVRKARGSDSGSDELNINQQKFPFMIRPMNRHQTFHNFMQRMFPNIPTNPKIYPNYNYPNNYNPRYNYPNYNYPNYNDNNPNQKYPSFPDIINDVPMFYNYDPSTDRRVNYLGVNGPQMNALSMSSEISVEDTSSMEDTNIMIPSMNVPYDVPDYRGHVVPDYGGHVVPDYGGHVVPDYQVPVVPNDEGPIVADYGGHVVPDYQVPVVPNDEGPIVPDYGGHVVPDYGRHVVPDYQVPGEPDDEGPIVPGVDTNDVDFGFDQTTSNELATEVTNAEEPADVLPYSDSVHNSESLGLNPDENSMMSESNEGISRQDLMYEPGGLDFNYDETLNNEEFVSQEVSRENSDEDDQTEENEAQNTGTNTVVMNSLSNEETNSNEDNQVNAADTSDDDGTDSGKDDASTDPNANNAVDSNPRNTADSNESGSQTDAIRSIDNNGAGSNQGANGNGAEPGEDDANAEVDNIQNEPNSCKSFHCRHGRVCELDEIGKPTCICQDMTSCPISSPELQQLCGTNNRTYGNSCQFFTSKCLLEGTKEGHSIHLDYIGPCKYIAPCLNDELDEFPLRLRDWLKSILMHMYERDLQAPGLLSQKERATIKNIYNNKQRLRPGDHSLDLLFNDFDQNYQMYVYPLHWQFHQMDRHPVDGYLTHSELAPLRDPLIPLEHCTSRFFTECDDDGDRNISLREWSKCFGLKEDIDPSFVF